MRIIIFGCGNIYRKYKNKLQNGVEIGGIIDHDEKLHGKKLDGIDVCYPKEIEKFDYDYIVLMSDSAPEMGEQLLQLGYSEKKIIHYLDFFGMFPCEMKKYAGVKNDNRISGKRLLIVSVTLSFTGVPIVSLLTAKAAVQLGYEVTIAADGGDIRYIQEAVNNGIDVLICDNLRNASLQRLSWTERYDKILVNSLPMIRLAVKLAKRREVNVWIHENPDEYERIRYWKREIEAGIQKETLRIYAPSKRAAYHFERWFGSQKEAVILPLGIEDRGDAGTFINNSNFAHRF